MHEIKFVKALVEDLVKRARELGARRITRVRIKMGEFSEIDPEVVRFYLQNCDEKDLFEGCGVEIEPAQGQTLILDSFEYEE